MDVAPALFPLDPADVCKVNAILGGSLSQAQRRSVDKADGFLRQFSQTVVLSARRYAMGGSFGLAPLRNRIRHVGELCAKKEMVDVNAGWGIAGVADVHPVGNWSLLAYPCGAMSEENFPHVAENSIALLIFGRNPQLASSGSACAVMRKTLSQRPILGTFELFSHLVALLKQRMVRLRLAVTRHVGAALPTMLEEVET